MTTDSNINLNAADCLRSVSDIGSTHVHNICTGAITDVPWGSADWVLVCAVTLFFGGAGLPMLAMAWTTFRDRY
jgi:hypothetical protein